MTRVISGALLLLVMTDGIGAQQPARRPIQLGELQDAARAADPRVDQEDWLQMQSELRLRNVAAQRLPSVSVEGQAQWQSDAATAPFTLPGGEPAFAALKSTYDLSIRVDERLFDTTIGAQAALERAQRDEQQARVRTTLFGLRQQVNDAFFAAAALEQRRGALRATIDDLEGRLRETQARVSEGTVLPAEAMSLEATLLQRRQDEEEVLASRRAALAQLRRLTGQSIDEADEIALPALATLVAEARQPDAAWRRRPEYEEFASAQERLSRQQELATAQERPQVSTFARVGYGRPGLNFVSSEFDTYALGGVQFRWRAWTWGAASRERAALAIQQRIVSAEQAAFGTQIGRATENDAAAIDRLQTALAADERIVVLREQILRTAAIRQQEGVITASEYLDRSTELLQARFAHAGHQVELTQVSARFLTTIGVEVR